MDKCSTHKTSSSPALQPGSEPLLLFLLETNLQASGSYYDCVEQNTTKRPKLESMQRFSTASEAQLTKVSKPFFPKKTEDATAWSLRNFHCWLNNRNSQDQLEKCPQNLLEDMDSKKLNYWLAVFLVRPEERSLENHIATHSSVPVMNFHNCQVNINQYSHGSIADSGASLYH